MVVIERLTTKGNKKGLHTGFVVRQLVIRTYPKGPFGYRSTEAIGTSSDEAIEVVLGTPKTTLRRWGEKAGCQWKGGAIEVPYRFKSLRGNEAVPFS